MAEHTLEILRCSSRDVLKVCLAIFQYYDERFSFEHIQHNIQHICPLFFEKQKVDGSCSGIFLFNSKHIQF